jgi:hypothetical protein
MEYQRSQYQFVLFLALYFHSVYQANFSSLPYHIVVFLKYKKTEKRCSNTNALIDKEKAIRQVTDGLFSVSALFVRRCNTMR